MVRFYLFTVTFNLFPVIFFSDSVSRLINMPGLASSRSGQLRQRAERVSIWRQVSEIVTRGSIKPSRNRERSESGDVRMLRVLDQLASSALEPRRGMVPISSVETCWISDCVFGGEKTKRDLRR